MDVPGPPRDEELTVECPMRGQNGAVVAMWLEPLLGCYRGIRCGVFRAAEYTKGTLTAGARSCSFVTTSGKSICLPLSCCLLAF
jgi:hypothetical protein